MYADYKQSSVPYQENYPIVYPHANFQHYRSSMPLSSGYELHGYEYTQQYYQTSQPTNSYGMLPSYNGATSNAFTAYNAANFHAPSMYPTYENLSMPSANNLLNIKTELESEQSETIDSNFVDISKNSPIESSDRSECSYSSKLEICSKSSELMEQQTEQSYTSEPGFGKDEITSSEFCFENCSFRCALNCLLTIIEIFLFFFLNLKKKIHQIQRLYHHHAVNYGKMENFVANVSRVCYFHKLKFWN